MAAMAAMGSMAGALAVRFLPGSLLAGIIPVLMIAIALYFGAVAQDAGRGRRATDRAAGLRG